ncbi:hypothetical protein [Streptomyces sp. NPDC003832]
MTDKIRAPWTPEQVTALNEFQHRGGMHPFTCGHEHPAHPNAILEATANGWRCYVLDCEYTQDWAHAFMADPSAWPTFPFGERHGPTPEEMKAATATAKYPYEDGDVTVLGPEIFAAADSKTISWKGENYVPQKRLRLAHQARRAKEHQLDDIRRALCDIGFMQDDDPYSHADLADVIRQNSDYGDAGPSVAECAAADRNWDVQQEGE